MGHDSTDTQLNQTVLLIAAVHHEMSATVKRLGLTLGAGGGYSGTVAGRMVFAEVTGVGAGRAVSVVDGLLTRHRPDWVVVLGFAGGLDPGLRAGEVVPISWVVDEQGEVLSLCGDRGDSGCSAVVPAVPRQIGAEVTRDAAGSLLTLDRLADSVSLKRELFSRSRCSVVDMETHAVARLLSDHGVALVVLRAVSDTADMALPAEAVGWVKPDGQPDTAAAAGYLTAHPWRALFMLRLGRDAKLAAGNLARRVEGLIRSSF
jgi:adenosylhomocysteine nucleosidase